MKKISWITAASLVVANMIGTGVFTSLGFQLLEVQNTWTILILWIVGGIMALIGALVYAELGTYFRKTGGDYIFLSETLHPSIGYLYAWISLTVGFSAPIAIAAMAMNDYMNPIFNAGIFPGLIFLVLIPMVHMVSVHRSGQFQNLFTLFKILFLLFLIGLGFFFSSSVENPSFDFSDTWKSEILLPGFSVSLIYVFYAYTGWNSAAYILEEIKNPQKDLPKALIGATSLVLILYVLFQWVVLKHASVDELSGQVQIAEIAFHNLLGSEWGKWIGILIGFQLIATISGYAWIGPRITYAMAKDFKFWSPLAKLNSNQIPVRAILLNTLVSLILFLSGSFEQVMIYAGFVLQVMGTITVYSSLKVKETSGFRTPFKPYLQYIYIIFSTAISIYIFWDKPMESLAGIGLMVLGLVIYYFDKKNQR
ncbi:APC family permease [Algoriphagus zhangzhouensis]|uniref:Basic amino acid/polyamine antiporter, APA family n=1 Tax=Algoriphagus zhangzhouensis TaxID=1073327 RepID=A0A1M7Z4S8_9BACT|nr:amino acid permease [Algoriphagus zhangzhouensis]TDY48674.1 amino acid/polyamine/organocation transporter (APC superfamily) [Algoriphagus zhangzhouensis]SHO59780.1 basic amino acid/polyamine antiporter, APA family [Algoriphagus zhangzhouensis]